MRLAKSTYYFMLSNKEYTNIGNILFEKDGVFTDIENIPDSFLMEKYGYTKEELLRAISIIIETEIE
jgi:hypothetical protein